MLDTIRERRDTIGDPEKCLEKMLYSWLRRDGLISGYPSPSWRVLCNAIHDAGENPALAESIAEEHSGLIAKQCKLYINS